MLLSIWFIFGIILVLSGMIWELCVTGYIMWLLTPSPVKELIRKGCDELLKPRKEGNVEIDFVLFRYRRTNNLDEKTEKES